ncbi:carbohydrate kinase family protein [Clostridium sp. Marseille-P2415]|uniref:carbohydrate kinase family protein n=1 Tax=Clostridium sp. Marseille-P2415 TaxID=1805471 RepID=UPI00098864AD|nr:carbohydrate kinase [Clostridium sp. Marseille-P2415]
MKEQYDVIALGELLIDFTENGQSGQGNQLFEANPGGAPCNVLSMLNKLGYRTAFIGKVGKDFFGLKLKDTLEQQGIDARNLILDPEVHTTLAMVHTLEDGDREFSFYRNPGADMMLKREEIQPDILKNTRIFHFGTLSMTHEDVRDATKYAVGMAARYGAMISFDPNLRPPLWNSMDEAREQVNYGLSKCQILKISDNEIQWLTGEEDYDRGVEKIRSQYDIPLILVSMGKCGSRAYYEDMIVEAAPYLMPETIETTGAGDTFCACVLHYVLLHGLGGLTKSNIAEMLNFANGAAAIVTTRKGALKVMPERAEIEKLISERIIS